MLSPEEFCDDVVAALQQGLPDALAAQTAKWAARDAAVGREIPLDVPPPESYYVGGAPIAITYPAIEIAVPDMGFTDLSLENYDGDAHPVLMVRSLFQMVQSPEWLYRMGCRWFAAIVTCIAAPGALGAVDIDGQRGLRASWRYNPETGVVDEVQSGVLVTFDLLGPLNTFAA